MTIAEAIASCDAQQPNAYSAAEKRCWLSELDGQLYDEVFLTHQDPPSFTPYTADTPQTTQLLLPHPHDRLYPLYLTMQIDRCNGEIARYNNNAQLFNDAYLTFQAHWTRTHTPTPAQPLRF